MDTNPTAGAGYIKVLTIFRWICCLIGIFYYVDYDLVPTNGFKDFVVDESCEFCAFTYTYTILL